MSKAFCPAHRDPGYFVLEATWGLEFFKATWALSHLQLRLLTTVLGSGLQRIFHRSLGKKFLGLILGQKQCSSAAQWEGDGREAATAAPITFFTIFSHTITYNPFSFSILQQKNFVTCKTSGNLLIIPDQRPTCGPALGLVPLLQDWGKSLPIQHFSSLVKHLIVCPQPFLVLCVLFQLSKVFKIAFMSM